MSYDNVDDLVSEAFEDMVSEAFEDEISVISEDAAVEGADAPDPELEAAEADALADLLDDELEPFELVAPMPDGADERWPNPINQYLVRTAETDFRPGDAAGLEVLVYNLEQEGTYFEVVLRVPGQDEEIVYTP